MTSQSPLGQFAPIVAAIVSIAVIVGWAIALAAGDTAAANGLQPLAYTAFVAILGVPLLTATQSANAKADAANARLDAAGIQPAAATTPPNGSAR